ncbi:nucleotidyltransferase [Sulfurovum sp.]|uniref:nucleotidyltransferase n=1 Tax=Sulfurovum sp. TaxID=1969726 RepID=UPI0025DA001A|nr:nucleotidyltransferase [Sulfurovum sp.]
MEYFEDYKDMLLLFNKYDVKYLVIGAYAMGNYGYSRHTLDIDLWVEKSIENAQKIQKAFDDFPVPHEITIDELNTENFVLQIGIEPMRIDILTDIDGVAFSEAWNNKTNNSLFGEEINFISLHDLIKNKAATDRLKDKYDVLELKKLEALKKDKR